MTGAVLVYLLCGATSPAACDLHWIPAPSVVVCNASAPLVLAPRISEGRELVWWRCAGDRPS